MSAVVSSYRIRQFTADAFDRSFPGWAPVGTPPELEELHKRSWHAPLFELPTALEIIDYLQKQPAGIVRAEYDAVTDTVLIEEDGNDPATWPGINIFIGSDIRTVYPIGNEEWEWWVVDEAETYK